MSVDQEIRETFSCATPHLAPPQPRSQAVLGVFQKLIASKAHDHEGFYILNTLIESLDYQGTMAQVRGLL